jgi:hypothetical protein
MYRSIIYGIILNNRVLMMLVKKYKNIFLLSIIAIIVVCIFYNYGENRVIARTPVNGQDIIKIKFNSVDLIYNNHVGNQWSYYAFVNDNKLKKGKSIVLSNNYSQNIYLQAKAVEEDSVPDVGSSNITINISKINFRKKNNYPVEVTVRENRGRYSGETAKLRFNFTVKRSIKFTYIIKNVFN